MRANSVFDHKVGNHYDPNTIARDIIRSLELQGLHDQTSDTTTSRRQAARTGAAPSSTTVSAQTAAPSSTIPSAQPTTLRINPQVHARGIAVLQAAGLNETAALVQAQVDYQHIADMRRAIDILKACELYGAAGALQAMID